MVRKEETDRTRVAVQRHHQSAEGTTGQMTVAQSIQKAASQQSEQRSGAKHFSDTACQHRRVEVAMSWAGYDGLKALGCSAKIVSHWAITP